MMRNLILILSICFILSSCKRGVRAQQPDVHLVEFASGFNDPLDIVHAGDQRLFIVERVGRIKIVDENGNTLPAPFLDIQSRVTDGYGEQGLLGLAFHPDYKTNGYFFVNYTGAGDTSHISRFEVSGDSNIADPNSEVRVLSVYQPYKNHNGGCVRFGPDGYLYIGFGDGGDGGDPQNNAQDSTKFLGKILRLDVDVLPYVVPPSNPFIGMGSMRPEIWALGLRNPWRFSFDRNTGDLWIADVGQNSWEEIDLQEASSLGGENYGWRCYEGLAAFNTSGCQSSGTYRFPIHEYENTGYTGDCSITGGIIYRGSKFPNLQGHYFYGDYCSKKLWSIVDSNNVWHETLHDNSTARYSSFGEDVEGELYAAGIKQGKIYRIVDSSELSGIRPVDISNVRLRPNPSANLIYVSVEDCHACTGKVRYNIISADGIKISSGVLASIREPLSVYDLEEGMYFLEINFSDEISRSRFIKKD